MKKIIVLASLMMLLATSAFAAGTTVKILNGGAINSTADNKPLGKLSTNVSLVVINSSTAFSTATKHLSGNREFGTSSTDTRIYYKEVATGVEAVVGDVTNSDSSDFQAAGWSGL
jgi:hypothetical protein